MRRGAFALVLVCSCAFAAAPADAPVVDQAPVVKIYPGHGECSNEAATRDREIERLAKDKELRDARIFSAIPVVVGIGVTLVAAVVATIAVLGATGHLK